MVESLRSGFLYNCQDSFTLVTLVHLTLEFSRVLPNVGEASAVGKIGGKQCHSAKKVTEPPTLTGPWRKPHGKFVLTLKEL
jgi:hypothetical protein